jgi:hypothetical protein
MKVYKVSSYSPEGGGITKYTGSEAEARQVRVGIMRDYGMKRKEVDITALDIPTSKGDLLVFLNDRKSRPVL